MEDTTYENHLSFDPMDASKPDLSIAELDEEYLEATFGDDEDFLREVLETYIASSEGINTQMRAATESGDIASLRSLAHTLKGSSRMIGANVFAEICQELETGDESQAPDIAERVVRGTELLIGECRRRLAETP